MKTPYEQYVVMQLLGHMLGCRRRGVSFADCMAEARKQFNKEVNQEALNAPLPE